MRYPVAWLVPLVFTKEAVDRTVGFVEQTCAVTVGGVVSILSGVVLTTPKLSSRRELNPAMPSTNYTKAVIGNVVTKHR